MILAGSLEFEKSHNNEVQERPSDNMELPQVFWSNSVVTTKSISLLYLFRLGKERHLSTGIVRRVFTWILLGLGIFLVDSYRLSNSFANKTMRHLFEPNCFVSLLR